MPESPPASSDSVRGVGRLVSAGVSIASAQALHDRLSDAHPHSPQNYDRAVGELIRLLRAGLSPDELLAMDSLDWFAIYLAMTLEQWPDRDVVAMTRVMASQDAMLEMAVVLVNHMSSLEQALALWEVTGGEAVSTCAWLVGSGLSMGDLEALLRLGVPVEGIDPSSLERLLQVPDVERRLLALAWASQHVVDPDHVASVAGAFEGDARTAIRFVLDGMDPAQALRAAVLLGASPAGETRVASGDSSSATTVRVRGVPATALRGSMPRSPA